MPRLPSHGKLRIVSIRDEGMPFSLSLSSFSERALEWPRFLFSQKKQLCTHYDDAWRWSSVHSLPRGKWSQAGEGSEVSSPARGNGVTIVSGDVVLSLSLFCLSLSVSFLEWVTRKIDRVVGPSYNWASWKDCLEWLDQ